MLLQIRKGLKELNDRQLVDTFFAIGKLHKGYEVNEVGKMLMPLMSYLIGDFLIEFQKRVITLDGMELAYLAKGIGNM